MSTDVAFKTAFCTGYDRLLHECQNALEACWRRRAEIEERKLVGKEAGDELLDLQAKYAVSYARLQKHVRDCHLCKFVSKLEEAS